MNTVKTTSSSTILSDIYRAFKPSDSDWVNDAQEWVFDAILLIDSGLALERGTQIIKVEDHRVKIPCNIETIEYVEYKGNQLLLGSDVSGYNISKDYPRTTITKPNTNYFLFNHQYINTSFESGEIKLHCSYIPFDKDGNITIIDNIKHRRFMFWYIVSQMIMSGYKAKDASINYVYADDQAMRVWLPKAQNALKYPSVLKMERLKSLVTRMRADLLAGGNNFYINHETTGFKDLGDSY